jgi:pyruvate ferredoxin oxidoreductase alpha subunit
MVCIDGFYVSHTYEPVDVPESVKGFLGEYQPQTTLDPKNPETVGAYATPDYYQEFKQQQQIAMDSALGIIKKTNAAFASKFGRKYGDGLVELTNMDSADYAIVTMGSVAGTIKHILKKEKIKDIGLVRLKSFRPFPGDELKKALGDLKSIGVLEKDISLGIGGALWSELRFIQKPMSNFIAGLGGRDIKEAEIKQIFDAIR